MSVIELFTSRKDFVQFRSTLNEQLTVGFVPTMGNLHRGHFSLVEQAFCDNDLVIVSIFVNPKQFAPHEDLDRYPRTLEQDINGLSMIARLQQGKRLCLFAPASNDDIYPPDFVSDIVVNHPMTTVLCAQDRPDHFAGVVTVVHRLFDLVKPHVAYFGQKDYQQLLIIKEMVKKYRLLIDIKSVPITRDDRGLALSSRNQYLNDRQTDQALTLPRTLKEVALSLKRGQDLATITEYKNTVIKQDPHWQYLEILSSDDLSTPSSAKVPLVIAGAYKLGATRLIDNIIVE